ncbi:unnamed protein product, partial [Lymnaea stagnalis]
MAALQKRMSVQQQTSKQDKHSKPNFEKGTVNISNNEMSNKNVFFDFLTWLTEKSVVEAKEFYRSNYPYFETNKRNKDDFKRASSNVKNIHFLDFENQGNFFMKDDLYNGLDMDNSIILLAINATCDISHLENKYECYKILKETNKVFVVRAVGILRNAADVCLLNAMIECHKTLSKDVHFFLYSGDTLFKDFETCHYFRGRTYQINQYPIQQTIITEIQTSSLLRNFDIDEDSILQLELDHILFWDIEKNIQFLEVQDQKKNLKQLWEGNILILICCSQNYNIPDLGRQFESYTNINREIKVLSNSHSLHVIEDILEVMGKLHRLCPINVNFSVLSDKKSLKKVNAFKDFQGRRVTKNAITIFNYYLIEIFRQKDNEICIFDPLDGFEIKPPRHTLIQTIKCRLTCEVLPKIIDAVKFYANTMSEIVI